VLAAGAAFIASNPPAMLASGDKAQVLISRGQFDAALGVLDARIEEIADLVPDHPGYLARLLRLKLVVLNVAGDDAQAILVADQLADRFATSTEQAVLVNVAHGYLQKSASLTRLGRHAEAQHCLDLVADRVPEEALHALDERIASVDKVAGLERALAGDLMLRAGLLDQLGRTSESIEAIDAVIERFGQSTDPAIAIIVDLAKDARTDLGADQSGHQLSRQVDP
jgi:tetratricopeptide (TPR) repeat protein